MFPVLLIIMGGTETFQKQGDRHIRQIIGELSNLELLRNPYYLYQADKNLIEIK